MVSEPPIIKGIVGNPKLGYLLYIRSKRIVKSFSRTS
jgi:hypothetical protein